MKIISKALSVLLVAAFVWIFVSFVDIAIHNTNALMRYSTWNFFVIVRELIK